MLGRALGCDSRRSDPKTVQEQSSDVRDELSEISRSARAGMTLRIERLFRPGPSRPSTDRSNASEHVGEVERQIEKKRDEGDAGSGRGDSRRRSGLFASSGVRDPRIRVLKLLAVHSRLDHQGATLAGMVDNSLLRETRMRKLAESRHCRRRPGVPGTGGLKTADGGTSPRRHRALVWRCSTNRSRAI